MAPIIIYASGTILIGDSSSIYIPKFKIEDNEKKEEKEKEKEKEETSQKSQMV